MLVALPLMQVILLSNYLIVEMTKSNIKIIQFNYNTKIFSYFLYLSKYLNEIFIYLQIYFIQISNYILNRKWTIIGNVSDYPYCHYLNILNEASLRSSAIVKEDKNLADSVK